jgi:peptidyl-prolyl cis-trans isomerase SurA
MHRLVILFCFLFVLYSCKTVQINSPNSSSEVQSEEPPSDPVVKLGNKALTEPDLVQAFEEYMIADTTDIDHLLEELVRRKRIFYAAQDEGYLLDESQKDELETYSRITAKSIIIDTSLVNSLTRLTYERLKREIKASHILLSVPKYAAPADTLLIFNQILNLKKEIEEGASFDSLAIMYSADINTKDKGGDMGYFSALQLLFPLENAAYSTPVGKISDPVRTGAGYHILKVEDNRPFSGKVEVRHLLKAVPSDAAPELEQFQKSKIDSLYSLILNGEDFQNICSSNSDDLNSKDNGGLLAPFSIGSWAERNFEKVAFGLNIGEVSEPVKSSIGWHLIKKVKNYPLESFDKLVENIRRKVTTDSRGEFLEKKGYANYRNKLAVSINQKAFESILELANRGIIDRSWKPNRNLIDNSMLLQIDEKVFSSMDFVEYAEYKQGFERQFQSFTPEMYLRWYFEDFKEEQINAVILEKLPDWSPNFKTLKDTYRESLIVTNYLNDKLYEKSVSDTTGQREFYEKNIGKYQWPMSANATIVKTKNSLLIPEYFEILNGEKPYRLKRGILPFYYEKNSYFLNDELKRKLTVLAQILEQNKGYIVEIGGHRDINEEPSISGMRIRRIVEYLTQNGVDITRIREYDYDVNKLVDRFDWVQNQRVSFQFFSKDKADIARILQLKDPSFEVAYGTYFKGENELIDGTGFEIGDFETNFDGFNYRITIDKIKPARAKTLREARGTVIKHYQEELEKQLTASLAVKYPVEIDKEKVKALYEAHNIKELNEKK